MVYQNEYSRKFRDRLATVYSPREAENRRQWEDVPYVVIDQPNNEIPGSDVKKDQPNSKRIRKSSEKLVADVRNNGAA
ncbi:hypothetical protein DPMN_089371 [Dreissena polymorpha]|uniref:Uncharacterized protein n=1 Tax=Dreissena polymorpha TaxID=45954 RepID=A0A9D4KWN1_DREPO|nr:hypothetical protein DPMN_089371 [Dreissena polymorpha]